MTDTGGDPASTPQSDADEESVARIIALRRLESAPRTRSELTSTLQSRGVSIDVIERVLDRFTEVGLIDDEAFAAAWVMSRHSGRGLGRRSLAQELRRKGVAPEVIEEACAQIGPEDERSRARAWAERRALRLSGVEPRLAVKRLVDALQRRGYPASVALDVAREVLGAHRDTDRS